MNVRVFTETDCVTAAPLAEDCVRPGPTHLALRPGIAGAPDLFLHVGETFVAAAHAMRPLLDELAQRNALPPLCEASIAQFLCAGVVPLPGTLFARTYRLGIGDEARVGWDQGRPSVSFVHDFPFAHARSRANQSPSTDTLLARLCAGVDRAITANPSVLLLSSGKDSTALALALAEGGHTDTHCVTWDAGKDTDESAYAQALCARLGLTHEVRTLEDTDPGSLDAYFARTPTPTADIAQIPVALMLGAMAQEGGTVLDGSGNDVYLGHVPSARDRTKMRWRLRSSPFAAALRNIVPHDSRLHYFLVSAAAQTLPGGYLRPRDLAAIRSGCAPVAPFWEGLSSAHASEDVFDFRAAIRGTHYDQNAVVLKVLSAAAACGADARFPWCDPDLVAYGFHLPESERFDRAAGRNKVLLRHVLRERVDYDEEAIGKRFFCFDTTTFFTRNRDRVVEEIGDCRLWQGGTADTCARWIEALHRRPRLDVGLNALYLLSAWANRSPYVKDS